MRYLAGAYIGYLRGEFLLMYLVVLATLRKCALPPVSCGGLIYEERSSCFGTKLWQTMVDRLYLSKAETQGTVHQFIVHGANPRTRLMGHPLNVDWLPYPTFVDPRSRREEVHAMQCHIMIQLLRKGACSLQWTVIAELRHIV
ncbi:hypothetical protein A0H81_05991 [Grifola frondosa]|uniref:Uncharacterized protein n=1 Tax=Grifola frondosa TaxID=5627 RepID=A0A1C7M9N5_GRIFR|nr:hypothetical protein A0H81_05991 [Grifola frondosa]